MIGRKRADGRARPQWGSDKRQTLPAIPPPATDRALAFGRLAIVVTGLSWLGYLITTVVREFVDHGAQGMRFATEATSYLLLVTLLTYSALAYLIARQGFLYRTRTHRRTPRGELDEFFAQSLTPTLTVLVPSYREDARVISNTMLSAALQEYPYLKIALLIDDPAVPKTAAHLAMLEAAQAVPGEIAALLAAPRERFDAALERFETSSAAGREPGPDDMTALAGEYEHAATWLSDLAEQRARVDHMDDFFVDNVARRLSTDLSAVAAALRAAAADGAVLPSERLRRLYCRLAWIFRAELSSFQRKKYASLSHEPNKAMNLNSYISLMGGSYREVTTDAGVVLERVTSGPADHEVSDPDYLLTLDADSIVLPEYCLRLVHILEQPENHRVAVAQTPYSSFPGAPTRLERIAGATTDLQHNLHQGMTYYDATFWVGANAVLRKRALDDVVEIDDENGIEIHRYIQDRTVIEDTESSIDMVIRGWTLYNYPERLSYSATPPDFGSLCIQRQRWANGGLLILPKLWRYLRERRIRGQHARLGEAFLRTNYLASIAWASVGLLFLLFYPYNDALLSVLVVVAAFPYFLAMSIDLRNCGYHRLDVFRIYGFNLILLPVNLSGLGRTLGQAVTARKLEFARTPKIRNRTTAKLGFVLIPYVILGFAIFTLVRDIRDDRIGHAIFAGTNIVLGFYAIVALIGIRNSLTDIFRGLVRLLYKPEHPRVARTRRARRVPVAPEPVALTWAQVLEMGSSDVTIDLIAEHQPLAPVTASASTSSSSGDAMVIAAQALVERLGQQAAKDGERLVLRVEGSSVVITAEGDAPPPADHEDTDQERSL